MRPSVPLALVLLAGCSTAEAGSAEPAAAELAPANPGVIAFVDRDADGDEEIFVVDPDGTNRRQLTKNRGLDTEPAVSPDGTRIAWAGEGAPGNVDVFTMNVDGTGKKRLTRHPQPDSDPTFSADGTRIAFRSDRRATVAEIWTMTVRGRDLRRLTDAGPRELQSFQPSFGPDGRIAFTSDRDTSRPNGSRNEIWTMECDGSAARRLTDNAFNDSTPAFSPRGDRIAFWSNEAESNVDVWTVRPDGSDRTRLTTDEGNDTEPAFSPDGTRIAFASTRDGGDAKRSGDDAVWTMDADGSNARRLTSGRMPSWGGGRAPSATDLSCEDEKAGPSARKGPEKAREVTQDTQFRAV